VQQNLETAREEKTATETNLSNAKIAKEQIPFKTAAKVTATLTVAAAK
jgi:hypothetical protein